MNEEERPSGDRQALNSQAPRPPWQLMHRTLYRTPNGGHHETCLYGLEDGNRALVQMNRYPNAEPWVETVLLTREEGRQFGLALCEGGGGTKAETSQKYQNPSKMVWWRPRNRRYNQLSSIPTLKGSPPP